MKYLTGKKNNTEREIQNTSDGFVNRVDIAEKRIWAFKYVNRNFSSWNSKSKQWGEKDLEKDRLC